MRIKSMRVENFRSVRGAALDFDGLTALVGANGAGKSTFLRDLLAFQGRQEPDEEDFYNRDTSREIRISVTFTGLPGEARERFARYLRGGDLEVTRICKYSKSGDGGAVETSLHGMSLRNPAFDAVRKASGPVDAPDGHDRLRGRPEYASLPGRAAARDALDAWEGDSPGGCGRALDDGRFFGFDEGAAGNLGRFIKILYIPASRGASEERKTGPHRLAGAAIMDMMSGGDRNRELQGGVDAAYDRAPAAGCLHGMRRMDDDISAVLGMLARGARVEHGQGMLAPGLGLLSTTIRLAEGGYTTTIDRVGDGLRRAFTIAMTAHMHGDRSGAGAEAPGDGPTVVLAIEEPELHQHPSQARHIAGLLSSISRAGLAGVARDVQVIYTTHSPHFVGADRMGQIRLVRKAGGGEGVPGATGVRGASMAKIRERLAAAGAPGRAGPEKLKRDLDRILTPHMSEGFFARTAVLVEGESDRIAILRAAEILGMPLDGRGVAIIPCGSKSGLLGPLAMFTELDVRTYPVWDGGGSGKREQRLNAALLSLAGRGGGGGEGGGCPDATTAEYSCLGDSLEEVLRSDMGEGLYDRLCDEYKEEYRLKKSDPKKPLVTHLLMEEMEERGIRPARLARIVGAILAGDAAGGPESA